MTGRGKQRILYPTRKVQSMLWMLDGLRRPGWLPFLVRLNSGAAVERRSDALLGGRKLDLVRIAVVIPYCFFPKSVR
jgi:hypothetical protein